MSWELKKFSELDTHNLYEILKLRVEVFVVEQNCPYPELDDYDQQALHLYLKENNVILAYCRILPAGLKYDDCSIGRVIVQAQARGKGHARVLMQKALKLIETSWSVPSIKLCAQSHLQNFYQSVGFQTISEEFDEDGIPHVYMIRSKKQ